MKLSVEEIERLEAKSPSVRRAWVEIVLPGSEEARKMVALRKEGVG